MSQDSYITPIGCVPLDKTLPLYMPLFLHLYNGAGCPSIGGANEEIGWNVLLND